MPTAAQAPPVTAKAVVPMTIRLPVYVYEAARAAAEQDTRTINNWIIKACREQAEREGFPAR